MREEISYIPLALLMILVVSVFTVPIRGFIYPDGSWDTNYELYGPHADKLIFQMYGSQTAMWTAQQLGQIDINDWPLTCAWRSTPYPYGFLLDPNNLIVSAGGGNDFFTIDFNKDINQIVPNSTRTPYKNPVWIDGSTYSPPYNLLGIPPVTTNVHFRLACGHLFDRAAFSAFLGPGCEIMIYTPVPAYMTTYVWGSAAGYTFSQADAVTELHNGNFWNNGTLHPGKWYWDYNNDGIDQQIEYDACKLYMTWRADAYRAKAGTMLYTELANLGFTFNRAQQVTACQDYQWVMLDKQYHIATLGWSGIGPDPDYLYDLYHVKNFWDDSGSACPNTAYQNDPTLDGLLEQIKSATSVAGATTATISAQQRFEAICTQIPLYSSVRFMASAKYYTGGNAGVLTSPDDGENQYRQTGSGSRREWIGFGNQAGYGSNTWFSMLNGWPNSTFGFNAAGTGNMTIRYGWSQQCFPEHINPFYSEWLWDSIVLGGMYDTLGYRNPYSLGTWMPDLVKNWTVGTWTDKHVTPNVVKSKVTLTLRPDIYWSDGRPITIADVIFSLTEAGSLLIAEGYSPPWWWPTGALVRSLSQLDCYTIEILYDVTSVWALGWTLGGFYIVPKHIWYPVIYANNPTAVTPDPNFICSGPWRYKSWIPGSTLVMVANKPGSTVTTDRAGATAITSPYGYHNYYPLYVNIHVTSPVMYRSKINIPHASGVTPPPWSMVSWEVDLINRMQPQAQGASPLPLQVNKVVKLINGTNGAVLFNSGAIPEAVPPGDEATKVIETFTQNITMCNHWITVNATITGPPTIDGVHTNPFLGKQINVQLEIWITIAEDIVGPVGFDQSNTLYPPTPSEARMPDCKVNILDVIAAAGSFGATPGSTKWNTVADINSDWTINILDIGKIAMEFGKWP